MRHKYARARTQTVTHPHMHTHTDFSVLLLVDVTEDGVEISQAVLRYEFAEEAGEKEKIQRARIVPVVCLSGVVVGGGITFIVRSVNCVGHTVVHAYMLGVPMLELVWQTDT